MATTSSMLSFSSDKDLIGCGIDSDHVTRFNRFCTGEERPSPLIFSSREAAHCQSLDDAAAGLCASFCCKEAVYKACKQPYNLNTCELLWTPQNEQYQVALSDEFRRENTIHEAIARVLFSPDKECVVTAFLFR